MLDKIRPWVAANPRWTLTLLTSVLLAPFLAKPFNLDDPLFIWLAQQVHVHPGDPFGFAVNWYGWASPMWMATENPPGAGYYFALAGSIFGWGEIGLHLGGLLAALAVILGTHRLARRFCGQPMLATCAVLFTPVFLVSANTIMCDVLMLAFWVWAVVFWMEGIEQDHSGKIIVAGVLIALALLTKYFGVALIPLLAVHGALAKRKMGPWIVGLLIPLAALGAYQWLTLALYHHGLFSKAAGYAASGQSGLGFSKLAGGLITLAFTGGGAATVLFLAPSLWRTRTLLAIFAGTALAGGTLCWGGNILKNYDGLEDSVARTAVVGQMIFWAIGGALALAVTATDVWRSPRDSRSWLLVLWVAGTLFFTAFGNWTVNGRSLLPLLPALGILLARRWEAGGQMRSKALQFGLAGSVLLALLVAQSDFQLAIAVRRSAQEACAKCAQARGSVWFEGHWGFQYYMDKLGALPVDLNHPKPQAGDILVIPAHNTDIYRPAPEIVARREVLTIRNPSMLATWNAAVGAGFYASVVGPLPFGFGKVPAETVFIYELRAAVPSGVK